MGLFGSNKKTFVGTQVSRAIEDASLPNSVIEGMAADMKEGSGQMIEQILDRYSNSIALRVNQMYSFGQKGYVHGLPSGSVHSSYAGKEASEAVITQQTGGPVQIQYYHFSSLNLLHVGWHKLVTIFGYDAATNQIASLSTPTKPVFLRNMRVAVSNVTLEEGANGSLDQWGTPPTAGNTPEKQFQTAAAGALVPTMSYVLDPNAPADYLIVDTCWSEKEPLASGSTLFKEVVKFGSFNLSLSGFDPLKEYHHAKYVDHIGKTGYWLYQDGAGNAELDAVFDTAYDDTGHFFPWMYFRFNKQSEAADKTSVNYKHAKKLAKHLSMDYDRLVEGIHENPDINDVEQAMMVMGVPAKTNDPIERRYLFDFFDGLYEQSKQQPELFSNAQSNVSTPDLISRLLQQINRSSMVIQDKRFKMALNWGNIIRRKVVGKVGLPGMYFSGFGYETKWMDVPTLSGDSVPKDTGSKRHWYQHQISENVYEEIQIFDLKMTYYVFGDYTTTGDEDDDILLIPVDMGIAKGYTLRDREVLFSRSMHYVFNSKVTIKLKWYQTGIFKAIVIIVMVIITIASKGTTIKGLMAAIAAGTITWSALAMVVVQMLIRQLIAMLLIRLFVKIVGVKIAFLTAIVAAIYGNYSAIKYASQEGLPFASEMLQLSSGLTQEIGRTIQQDMNDLLGEQNEFALFVKEQTKLLDEKLLDLNQNINLTPIIVFGESPSDFYERTVHSGNIGVIGLDAVSSFVDVALTLPKLSDTI